MKRIIIYILILILCLSFSPNISFADSPEATLTVDGTLVGSYPSVQDAVDEIAAHTGSNFVIEIAEGTVTDPLDILQLPDKNVVIQPQPGASVVFTNTITIDGNGNLNNSETLLIQGLTFDFTSGSPENCIYFNLLPSRVGHSYPHNVTINGCTFRGVFDTTVAVQSIPGGSRNIAIMNCTATDMHSLAQLKAVSGYAFIQNCIVSNAGGGVNFYGTGDLIVDSCKFDVVGYAVRSGQGSGIISNLGSVTINNSILNSNSMEDGTVVLRGDSTNNINIVHSNLENANPDGSIIQNLNPDSDDKYNIDIVESNLTGQITGIDLSTITTTDDPNVENGPVCIISENGNGQDDNLIKKIILMIIKFIILLILLPLIIIIAVIRFIFSRRSNSLNTEANNTDDETKNIFSINFKPKK